jgi:outer membrane biosynthesis protein TonB
MRRDSAAIVLMLLSIGCMHAAKPQTQPPPVAAAPETSTVPTAVPAEAGSPASTDKAEAEPAPPPKPQAESAPPVKSQPQAAAPVQSQPQAAPTEKAPPQPAPTAKAQPQPVPAKRPAQPSPSAKGQAEPAPPAKAQAQPAAPAKQAAAPGTLDLEALKARLKETKAIGLMTKLSLKNKVDDLLDEFRQHHAGKSMPTVAELRRAYDLLMMKVLSLLQDKDKQLASDILSSREGIWGLLADPKKFAALQAE